MNDSTIATPTEIFLWFDWLINRDIKKVIKRLHTFVISGFLVASNIFCMLSMLYFLESLSIFYIAVKNKAYKNQKTSIPWTTWSATSGSE